MASPRVRFQTVRALPLASLLVLGVWTAWEVLLVDEPRLDVGLQGLLVVGIVSLFVSFGRWGAWPRRSGILLLALAYFVTRIFVSGLDLVPALVYLILAIASVEFQILSDRLAPLYSRRLPRAEERRIDAAMTRSVSRLAVASLLAFLVPLLAADLARSGALPATTIPTALGLSAAVIAIVAWLALLPGRVRPTEE